MATEDDLYGVIVASSSYLYTSGKFCRRRNRQTWPRRFWVHHVLRRRDNLGEYAVQTHKGTSAGQRQVPPILSDVNRAVWLCYGAGGTTHFTSPKLPTVYVAVYVQGRTTSYVVSYDVVRSVIAAYDTILLYRRYQSSRTLRTRILSSVVVKDLRLKDKDKD